LAANISSSSAASRVAVGGAVKVGAETREARFGERVEQRLAVGEVPSWGPVADANLACETSQRQVRGSALAQRALGLLQQRRAEVAVVVGTLSHRREG
jgi:hypothetical protein